MRVISFRHEQNAGNAAAIAGYLTKSPGVCLTVSAPGFRRVYYFVSLCYAGAIAAQGLMIWITHRDTLSGAVWLMAEEASPSYTTRVSTPVVVSTVKVPLL